jgi:enoyl-CoA hydratase
VARTASIAVEDHDGVAVVRVQRAPANAMDHALLAEGIELAASLRASSPWAVVLTGTGDFFSGGVDLKAAPTWGPSEQAEMVRGISEVFAAWYGFPRPVVAAVNGHAVAGGLILALCADHRIVGPSGRFGLTEVKVGIPYPVMAMACVRAELSPGAARRLVLGGELMGAEEALALGVFDELVPSQELVVDRAVAVARSLADVPGDTYERVKEQLRGPVLRAAQVEDPLLGSGWLVDR